MKTTVKILGTWEYVIPGLGGVGAGMLLRAHWFWGTSIRSEWLGLLGHFGLHHAVHQLE